MANLLLENTLDARRLVEKLTGLQEGKQFERWYDYTIANLFQIPKFLDVNSHKVLRSVEGLRDKFYIHAQSHKAEHFYALCQDLLKSSVFKDNGTADVPFSILSLLFELANRPTEVEYVYTTEEDESKHDEENKLPCTKLDENDQQLESFSQARSISPISDLSDWSDDSEVEQWIESVNEVAAQAVVNDCSKSIVSHISETRNDVPVSKTGLSGRAWLYQNLEGPSWGQMTCTAGDKIRDLQSMINTSLHLEDHDGESLFLSERQIIRESLWMLEGRKECRVFEFNKDKGTFAVNPKIRTSHLTQDALRTSLLPLANSGSIIQTLKQFVEDVIEVNAPFKSVSPSQTYKAYASSISETLCLLTKDLAKTNKVFVEQKSTFTLAMLIESFEAWGRKLDVLELLHRNGVQSCHPDWSSATRAAHLLNGLFSVACDLDVLGDNVFNEMELALSIFFKSIRPYLDIIDVWITKCSLNDPCQEFIIACNTHAKTLDETFWTNAIVLREIPWVKRGSMNDSAVSFLQPVMKMLLLIGRSVEVLRRLGALGRVIKHDAQPLFSSVMESLAEYSAPEMRSTQLLESGVRVEKTTKTGDKVDAAGDNWRHSARMLHNLDSEDMYDPILTGYFKKKYFRGPEKEKSAAVEEDADCSEINASVLKYDGKSCLRVVLERALSSNITRKFEYVCSCLMNLFNNEYQLKESLLAFRRYFLMKSGAVMFQFASQLFDTIPAGSLLNKKAELNILLEDALSVFYPKDIPKLSVDVDETVAKDCKNAIDGYDAVKLVYRISWPLTIIITSDCKKRYDRVFSFLIKVKYAKYRLDELQFRDIQQPKTMKSSKGRLEKTMAMYMCRIKLLHFVNGLHHYVLTHVLHDTKAICTEIYGKDKDLERIISANEDYVNTICERCLLHPTLATIMDAVVKILDLALTFSGLWNNFDNVSLKDVAAVERDLDASFKKIESFVQYISIQESLPYPPGEPPPGPPKDFNLDFCT